MPTRSRAEEQEWEALHRVADSLIPAERTAFLRAVKKLKPSVSLAQLSVMIESRDFVGVERVLGLDLFEQALSDSIRELALQGALKGAQVSSVFLPEVIVGQLSFDRVNLKSVEWARNHSASLVRNISTETRLAIREIIARSFELRFTPQSTAKALRQIIGLTVRDANAVLNYKLGLQAQGKNTDRIESLVEKYHQRLLRARAETIARTETIHAANMGQQLLWRSAQESGLFSSPPRRVWIVTPDDRLCPFCRALGGKVVGFEEEFVSVVKSKRLASLVPPLHPKCRCAVGLRYETNRLAA